MKLLNNFKNNPATFVIIAIAIIFIIYGIAVNVTFPIWLGAGMLVLLIVGTLLMLRRW